jgi:hypothetical protein
MGKTNRCLPPMKGEIGTWTSMIWHQKVVMGSEEIDPIT